MSGSSARPRLVYDGDCRFCRYTVGYAQSLTGDAVEYAPFQAVAAEHPDIDAAEFRATIILLKDGLRFAGARAAFEVLALGGRSMWIRLYLHTPLFAACAERAYRWTSRHRALAYRALRPLFGRTLAHRELRVTGALVRRGIFLCGLAAFVSLWYQIDALVGPGGISPAARFLEQVAGVLGAERYWRRPSPF